MHAHARVVLFSLESPRHEGTLDTAQQKGRGSCCPCHIGVSAGPEYASLACVRVGVQGGHARLNINVQCIPYIHVLHVYSGRK
jgi:hypothetical protein